jgi:hypothetical protein
MSEPDEPKGHAERGPGSANRAFPLHAAKHKPCQTCIPLRLNRFSLIRQFAVYVSFSKMNHKDQNQPSSIVPTIL